MVQDDHRALLGRRVEFAAERVEVPREQPAVTMARDGRIQHDDPQPADGVDLQDGIVGVAQPQQMSVKLTPDVVVAGREDERDTVTSVAGDSAQRRFEPEVGGRVAGVRQVAGHHHRVDPPAVGHGCAEHRDGAVERGVGVDHAVVADPGGGQVGVRQVRQDVGGVVDGLPVRGEPVVAAAIPADDPVSVVGRFDGRMVALGGAALGHPWAVTDAADQR